MVHISRTVQLSPKRRELPWLWKPWSVKYRKAGHSDHTSREWPGQYYTTSQYYSVSAHENQISLNKMHEFPLYSIVVPHPQWNAEIWLKNQIKDKCPQWTLMIIQCSIWNDWLVCIQFFTSVYGGQITQIFSALETLVMGQWSVGRITYLHKLIVRVVGRYDACTTDNAQIKSGVLYCLISDRSSHDPAWTIWL